MSIKKRVMALACTGMLLFSVPASAASNDSYAGQVKIQPLDAADSNMQTTVVEKSNLNVTTDLKVYRYRIPALYTEYWDGEETEIIEWTDKTYVHTGDVVVELKSGSDAITRTELELRLTRSTESYDKQCGLYKEQIKNKKTEIAGLSGTEKKIAQLELKKMQSQYEQYRYDYAQSTASLKEQLQSLQSTDGVCRILAKEDGYLYIPNENLRKVTSVNKVKSNQALFSIIEPGACAFAMQENIDGGTLTVGMTDGTCDAVIVCDKAMTGDYGLWTDTPILSYSKNGLTREMVESISGAKPESKLNLTLSYIEPIRQDVIVLKTMQVYCSNDEYLSTKLLTSTDKTYDFTARYYVRVLQDGMEHKRLVMLGPMVDEYVVVLSGLEPGEELVI